ncbi:uncharacterized protein Z519_02701 [Cladophialophora bantiana CBS 173.52]|uniref:Ketoreductase domain-containing protein n=1 Tax=Cladophialophora bantiana (strain ATCC 10958 / CBS 173.52 / CDC B-1940 / NIH 8579) TaxID=1442370 RepID=A0A0D2IKG0_CLAB1|nr:uncharacterized protein Z519_02701 [Cladophialophora bantiana CBS 173.52]KIW97309.1 hypothetical protein Z519_02701 [Cladophialophora bantiana CBS 173.52]
MAEATKEQASTSKRGLLRLPAQTLQDKVAIVSGSSRGLGADMALDLAKRGAKVVITYASPSSTPKADTLVQTIKDLPNESSAIAVCADLSQPWAPAEIVKQTLSKFGPHIHILVNNAAVQITRPLADITQTDYDRVYNVNVRGTILLTQAVLPHLAPRARVINISSVGARAGFAALSLYTSSKAALEGLTRSWAAELGKKGTTVNCVAPGPVQSEMLDSIPTHIVQMQMDNTPLENRVGTPQEVSNVVSWLAGDESAWITGQVLNVSGGWTMY